jgi:hypothetical protein
MKVPQFILVVLHEEKGLTDVSLFQPEREVAMELAGRVKGILFQPKQEWETVSGESSSIVDIYRGYVIILAAIGPVASIIGMSIIGVSLPFVGSFRIPITT